MPARAIMQGGNSVNTLSKFLIAAALAATMGPALAVAQQPAIKVAGIFAMTGPAAELGASASEGIRYALDEVNKTGGLEVNGVKYRMELTVYDDQFKPAETVAAYTRARDKDHIGFMFDMISASHLAIKDMIESDNVFMSTSAISPKAIDKDVKHVVRIQGLVADYLPGVVKFVKDHVPGDRIVQFYPNDESGKFFADIGGKDMTKVGYKVIDTEFLERSATEFQSILTRVIALKPDVIDLGPTNSATDGLIVRQARELGYKNPFIVTGGNGAKGIADAAGNAVAEGIYHVLYADPNNPAYKTLADRYRAKFHSEPNGLIANFYDGAVALMKAIQIAGTPDDPDKVREAYAKAYPMKSVQGATLTFGGKDTLGVDAQVYTVNYIAVMRNGQSVVVGTTQ
jgi:branched-chain amino acid transport system substrate-binding protein